MQADAQAMLMSLALLVLVLWFGGRFMLQLVVGRRTAAHLSNRLSERMLLAVRQLALVPFRLLRWALFGSRPRR